MLITHMRETAPAALGGADGAAAEAPAALSDLVGFYKQVSLPNALLL
jgi:hypothetical protein